MNTPGLCECGCGKPAPIAEFSNKWYGYVKGQPKRFIHGHMRLGSSALEKLRQARLGKTWAIETRAKMALSKNRRTHGMTGTTEYRAWGSMIGRCTNESNRRWKDYGGRGITVCERWLESFDNFLLDMGRKPDPALSLDRINNDGDYCKENCRWATRKQQRANRRK